MGKSALYLTLDTETATLPFVNEWGLSPDDKKKIAIAKPLVYDIGWTIATRSHGIVERRNYLVAETFSVPAVFNTAYYREKRPLYLGMLERKEIEVLPWNSIMEILIQDLNKCSWICAYNAMFDFKKAIIFTETYINRLYSPSYYEWEEQQKEACAKIIRTKPKRESHDFDKDNFILRGVSYPMIDIWGLACTYILNCAAYKKSCLENKRISNTGTYFSTSAESAMQFFSKKFGFIEDHTALSDAEIETELLFASLKRGKLIQGIIFFPYKMLGDTVEFVMSARGITWDMANVILNQMKDYLPDDIEYAECSNYQKQILRKISELEQFMYSTWDV